MFIRQKFITNSSNTSFIFYGIAFDSDSALNIFEKIVPIEKRGLDTDYEEMSETLYNWAEGLMGDVSVYVDWESNYGAVYIRDSYESVEGSFVDIPLDDINKSADRLKEWDKKIRVFCKEYGIVPAKGYMRTDKMGWKIALEVNR